MTRTHEITDLLQAWSRGDSEALAKLLPLVDHELRQIAHAFMIRERTGHTLQTTALINEAILSLLADEPIDWKSRKHFYAIVTWRMRNILIEYARGRLALKRGKGAEHVDFDEAVFMTDDESEEMVILDNALTKLAKIDSRKAMIVQHRYFGGMTTEEIADLLDISPSTVDREWRFARSWLKREMS
ncbi:MAG TPA: sigma-70 family RNA polymerase sigma factor [Pyrinomonadaceae bacterium]|nr:sigma-70 family RNA polymerase sigma factor [Pyrinomonadaceae bacterium]